MGRLTEVFNFMSRSPSVMEVPFCSANLLNLVLNYLLKIALFCSTYRTFYNQVKQLCEKLNLNLPFCIGK